VNVQKILLSICLAFGLSFGSGCTALCVRDSDCMGASICSENRCLLIVMGDAGRLPVTPSNGEGTPSTPSTPSTPPPDAASSDAGAIR
jgi:hypothetical protein